MKKPKLKLNWIKFEVSVHKDNPYERWYGLEHHSDEEFLIGVAVRQRVIPRRFNYEVIGLNGNLEWETLRPGLENLWEAQLWAEEYYFETIKGGSPVKHLGGVG